MSETILTEKQYHEDGAPTYRGQTDGAYKASDKMAVVSYVPAHYEPENPAGMEGRGETLGKWVFNEETGQEEGILTSGIELFMDTKLAPNASVGMHRHATTEEIYYLLEGNLNIKLFAEGDCIEISLFPGDAHLIRPNQSHYIEAGEQGARIIVVAAKAGK